MISSKNLLLNVAPQTTTSANTSTNSPDDVLAFMVNDTQEKKEDNADANTVDPSSFVLLLSQLFTSPPQTSAANEENTASDPKSALINQLANPALNQQINPESQQAVDAANLLTAQTIDPNAQEVDTENPALNWLDSENFKTLKADGNNSVPVDSTSKPANPKVSTDLNMAVNTALPQTTPALNSAPASDGATVTTAAQNPALSLQELNSTLKTIDNIPTAPVGVKSDSKPQDLISSLSNNIAMPVVTNQPTQLIAPPKSLEIPVPVNHPQWGDQFADHIAWLGNNDIKSAVIKIHPEDLGPIEINVKVVKDAASVNIISHSAQVRDVMDQAIPKLRDMMSAQGLNLAEVQISADQRSGNAFAQNNNSQQQQNEAGIYSEGEDEVQLVSTVKKPPKGLVDYFA
ncbi:flagellar hook-length control protein FliK [Legionella sp. km772]|uniref:flagellar hook-length control protein FliK n=1 Tax=Legionella sp. km772 TaxID=2498111 RepID=UPI000F8E41A1|nr:flagellar hook-length control protein FliK [Legionella sp. km772]RUR05253.1 flagellar hook-length control protein FliK [Legionella sp. km772]